MDTSCKRISILQTDASMFVLALIAIFNLTGDLVTVRWGCGGLLP